MFLPDAFRPRKYDRVFQSASSSSDSTDSSRSASDSDERLESAPLSTAPKVTLNVSFEEDDPFSPDYRGSAVRIALPPNPFVSKVAVVKSVHFDSYTKAYSAEEVPIETTIKDSRQEKDEKENCGQPPGSECAVASISGDSVLEEAATTLEGPEIAVTQQKGVTSTEEMTVEILVDTSELIRDPPEPGDFAKPDQNLNVRSLEQEILMLSAELSESRASAELLATQNTRLDEQSADYADRLLELEHKESSAAKEISNIEEKLNLRVAETKEAVLALQGLLHVLNGGLNRETTAEGSTEDSQTVPEVEDLVEPSILAVTENLVLLGAALVEEKKELLLNAAKLHDAQAATSRTVQDLRLRLAEEREEKNEAASAAQSLTLQVAELKRSRQADNEMISTLRARMYLLEKEHRSNFASKRALSQDVCSLRIEKKALEERASDAENMCNESRETVQTLTTRLHVLEGEKLLDDMAATVLKQKVAELETAAAEERAKHDTELAANINFAAETRREHATEVARRQQAAQDYQAELDAQRMELEQMTAALQRAETEKVNLEESYRAACSKMHLAEKSLEAAVVDQETARRLAKEVDALQNADALKIGQIAQLEEQYRRAQLESAQRYETIQQRDRTLAEERNEAAKLASEAATAQHRLEATILEKAADISEKSAELSSVNEELAVTVKELNACVAARHKNEGMVTQLREQLSSEQHAAAEVRFKLQSRYDSCRRQRAAMSRAVCAALLPLAPKRHQAYFEEFGMLPWTCAVSDNAFGKLLSRVQSTLLQSVRETEERARRIERLEDEKRALAKRIRLLQRAPGEWRSSTGQSTGAGVNGRSG